MFEFVYLRFVFIQFVLRVKRFITASTVYWFQIISLFYRIMARAILSSLDWTAAYLTVIASIFITVCLTQVCARDVFPKFLPRRQGRSVCWNRGACLVDARLARWQLGKPQDTMDIYIAEMAVQVFRQVAAQVVADVPPQMVVPLAAVLREAENHVAVCFLDSRAR